MNKTPSKCTGKPVSHVLCAGIALALLPLTASALDGIQITGTNTEYSQQNMGTASAMSIAGSGLCSPGGAELVFGALSTIKSRMDPRLGELASANDRNMPSGSDIADAMNTLCGGKEPFSTAPFRMIYAECRMTMDSAGQMLDIVIPPDGTEGKMDVADFGTGEAMRIYLQRALTGTAAVLGSGWSNTVDMKSLGSGGSVAGYPTTKFQFSYSGGLGGAGATAPGAGMVSTTSSGYSWVSDQVDGINIVQDFYRTFTSQVDASQGSGSFMSGLISNLVVMLEKGMPMKMEQTVESKVAGMTMVSGKSAMEVYSVNRVTLPNDWCGQDFIPAGMPIQDVNEQIDQAMGGMDPEQAQAISDAQQQMNEAMQQMSPNQRAMMEKMGLGKMMGGAAPAAAPAAAPRSSKAAASDGPDPYYSDNVTQMVQRQLKALGYDPGNTDGDESMQTSIAISQFQAENKMPVTGKATPQLAGILSARLSDN